jgi:hypothetical protein
MQKKPPPPRVNGAEHGWLSVPASCSTLGISTFSFYDWRRKHCDFPGPREDGRYSIDELQCWRDNHPEKGQGAGNKVTGRREDLMCQNLEKRNALLDRQIAEADGRLVDGAKVVELFVRERTLNLEAFRKRVLSEIPAEAEGKPASKIAQLLKDAFDEYLDEAKRSIAAIVRAA